MSRATQPSFSHRENDEESSERGSSTPFDEVLAIQHKIVDGLLSNQNNLASNPTALLSNQKGFLATLDGLLSAQKNVQTLVAAATQQTAPASALVDDTVDMSRIYSEAFAIQDKIVQGLLTAQKNVATWREEHHARESRMIAEVEAAEAAEAANPKKRQPKAPKTPQNASRRSDHIGKEKSKKK